MTVPFTIAIVEESPVADTPGDGWRTSIGAGGKAHFYTDGKSACAARKGIWPGAVLGDLFKRPTRPTTNEDHVCRYCAKAHARECVCWSCTMKRAGKKRCSPSLLNTRSDAIVRHLEVPHERCHISCGALDDGPGAVTVEGSVGRHLRENESGDRERGEQRTAHPGR